MDNFEVLALEAGKVFYIVDVYVEGNFAQDMRSPLLTRDSLDEFFEELFLQDDWRNYTFEIYRLDVTQEEYNILPPSRPKVVLI